MKSRIKKLFFLLTPPQKKQLLILGGLLLIGMFFEMMGLGVLIPALGLMMNSANIVHEYPSLQPIFNKLGNPTQLQLVLWGMSILVIVYLVKAAYLIFLSWRQSKFSAELSADVSQNLFMGYLKQPYTFHLQRNSAQLLRNIQIEINQLTAFSQAVVNLSLELCVVFGIAAMLILVEPVGALVVTSFLGVSAFGFHLLTKNKLLLWGENRQLHQGLGNQHLLQGLGGVKDVKLMGKEEYFFTEYAVQNQKYAKITMKVTTLALIPRVYLEVLAVVGLAGLIVLMVIQNKPMDLLMPTLGVFVAAAFRMIPSVNRIMTSIQTMRYSEPVLDVLYDEFSLIKSSEKFPQSGTKLNPFTEFVISDLAFKYESADSKALNGINIQVKKGESVGFIGPSGSGKSTLVDVILGLLAPDSGSIKVDGENIQIKMRSWQDQVGYVPQSIYLTDDSLKHNVAFGIAVDKIDDLAVNRAIKAAQLDEFVTSLPLGLDTFVGERGVRLSGGQRQRIGIARALYHDPAVLVLDEATSALDTETERGVMQAVTALRGEKTLLIVAHRLSTVKNCDRIYRLEKGKIVDEGVPEKMLDIQSVS